MCSIDEVHSLSVVSRLLRDSLQIFNIICDIVSLFNLKMSLLHCFIYMYIYAHSKMSSNHSRLIHSRDHFTSILFSIEVQTIQCTLLQLWFLSSGVFILILWFTPRMCLEYHFLPPYQNMLVNDWNVLNTCTIRLTLHMHVKLHYCISMKNSISLLNTCSIRLT